MQVVPREAVGHTTITQRVRGLTGFAIAGRIVMMAKEAATRIKIS